MSSTSSSFLAGLVVLGGTVLAVAMPPLGIGGPDSYDVRAADGGAATGQDVRRLDPDLRDAVRAATDEAAADGVVLHVNSGWRSAGHQARLFREAVLQYGSEAEASRWVATPETSVHVSGDAVDIGPTPAAAWLADHGSAYGLCRVYANEPWHFELVPDASDDGCPPTYADPTQDPRMQ